MKKISIKTIFIGLIFYTFSLLPSDYMYNFYCQGVWVHLPNKSKMEELNWRYPAYEFESLEKYFYERFNQTLQPQSCIGVLLGAIIATMVYETIKIKPEDMIDLRYFKKDEGDILSYNQRLEFLKKELTEQDLQHINIFALTAMTRGFSLKKIKTFVTLLKNLATEYDINYMEKDASLRKNIVRYYPLEMSHVFLALDEISSGTRVFYDSDIESRLDTAIHEAGHAVACIKNKDYILNFVSMITRAKTAGKTYMYRKIDFSDVTLDELKYEIIIDLCGGIAEQVFGYTEDWYRKYKLQKRKMPKDLSKIGKGLKEYLLNPGVESDLKNARMFAHCIVKAEIELELIQSLTEEEIEERIFIILDDCYKQAIKLLQENKKNIEKIAQQLMNVEILSGDEIYAICGETRPLFDNQVARS